MKKEKIQNKLKILILVKVLMWGTLFFLVFLGIRSIVVKDSGQKVFQNNIEKKMNESDKKRLMENSIRAFSENFMFDYFYNDGNNKEYLAKLNSYGLEFKNRMNPTEIKLINTKSINWENENLAIVKCNVKVDIKNIKKVNLAPTPANTPVKVTPKVQTTKKTIVKKPQPKKVTPKPIVKPTVTVKPTQEIKVVSRKYVVQIAVSVKGKNLTLANYPLLLEDNVLLNNNNRTIKGNGIENNDEKVKIQNSVESFISAYYEGSETDLSYYLKDANLIKPANSGYKAIVNKNDIVVYKQKDKYNVQVHYIIENTDIRLNQGMELIIIKDGNKYIIEKVCTAIF